MVSFFCDYQLHQSHYDNYIEFRELCCENTQVIARSHPSVFSIGHGIQLYIQLIPKQSVCTPRSTTCDTIGRIKALELLAEVQAIADVLCGKLRLHTVPIRLIECIVVKSASVFGYRVPWVRSTISSLIACLFLAYFRCFYFYCKCR